MIFWVMSALFVASVAIVFFAERHATPAQQWAGIVGQNFEGEESASEPAARRSGRP